MLSRSKWLVIRGRSLQKTWTPMETMRLCMPLMMETCHAVASRSSEMLVLALLSKDLLEPRGSSCRIVVADIDRSEDLDVASFAMSYGTELARYFPRSPVCARTTSRISSRPVLRCARRSPQTQVCDRSEDPCTRDQAAFVVRSSRRARACRHHPTHAYTRVHSSLLHPPPLALSDGLPPACSLLCPAPRQQLNRPPTDSSRIISPMVCGLHARPPHSREEPPRIPT